MSTAIEVKNLHLAHKMGEVITVTHVEQPHGNYSDPVVNIGVSYHGEKNKSMVEIPYSNIDDVINALNESKKVYSRFIHEDLHAELNCDVGGGQ